MKDRLHRVPAHLKFTPIKANFNVIIVESLTGLLPIAQATEKLPLKLGPARIDSYRVNTRAQVIHVHVAGM